MNYVPYLNHRVYVEIKPSFTVFDTSYCWRETNGKCPNAQVC